MPEEDHTSPNPPRSPQKTFEARPAPQQVFVVQQSGFLRGALAWLGWLVAGLCLVAIMGLYTARMEYFDTTGGIQEKYHSLSTRYSDNKIAVIDASGLIMGGDGFVKRQIDQIRKDERVKGIVLRVDSPGGTVYGSDFIYHHLVKLREERQLPMVVSMGSVAASGGYYIAMAVGEQENCVFAEPMTTTGSIGVKIPHYNVSGLMRKLEIEDDTIATHPRKTMLSITKPMTEDDREVIGRYLNHAFDRFKNVIKQGRPRFVNDEASLNQLATGEAFTAEQAKATGLVDEIGFIEQAIDRVIEMAGLDKSTTRVITYKKPVTLMDALAVARSPKIRGLAEQLDLGMPRAYYLMGPIPGSVAASGIR